jgi:hypothetical protein
MSLRDWRNSYVVLRKKCGQLRCSASIETKVDFDGFSTFLSLALIACK